MIIGTTPTLTFKVKRNSDINFFQANNIYVTLKQGNFLITKTGQDVHILDSKTIFINLTQAESLQFTIDKKVYAQLNWTFVTNGTTKRAATKVITINLGQQLLNEAIT